MMNVEETIMTSMSILFLLIMYTFKKNHVMNNLIVMEFLVISILMSMFMFIKTASMENYLIIYFTILMIVESVLGISIMISMIRTHGNDFIKTLSIMKL